VQCTDVVGIGYKDPHIFNLGTRCRWWLDTYYCHVILLVPAAWESVLDVFWMWQGEKSVPVTDWMPIIVTM